MSGSNVGREKNRIVDENLVPLPRSFYARSADVVAPALLGKYLVRRIGPALLIGEVIETEAYLPHSDAAAHSHKGENIRNGSLFKAPGTLYIHAQRHHTLMDVVTNAVQVPGSVLIRAALPLQGIETMFKNRERVIDESKLTNGPAKVCQAFGITKLMDGIDCTNLESPLFFAESDRNNALKRIKRSKRIGITKAADALLRFTWGTS